MTRRLEAKVGVYLGYRVVCIDVPHQIAGDRHTRTGQPWKSDVLTESTRKRPQVQVGIQNLTGQFSFGYKFRRDSNDTACQTSHFSLHLV